MGIEPTYLAWEARALPLSYTRNKTILIIHCYFLKVNTHREKIFPDFNLISTHYLTVAFTTGGLV